MSAIFKKATNTNVLMWECKSCHQPIDEHETVAYHLVSGILYGWCPGCFSRREPANKDLSSFSAASTVSPALASAIA
jgi:hypothetical protein